MEPAELRIALFSGNYNYVRDGANQALNRLVGYLLRRGAQVRVYSPVVEDPAFPPTGDLVNVPSIAIPGRKEYRLPIALPASVKADLAAFDPNVIHIASPDIVAHRAVSWARRRNIPAVASVHTRFDTYLQYYHLAMLEPVVRGLLRRLYQRCDAIVAPALSTASILRAQRMNKDISIWARGVDRNQFNPKRRSMEWRREMGLADADFVIGYLGRVVMEKGLDVFADAIRAAREAGIEHRVLVIGEGPAREWFAAQLPEDTVFTGELAGNDLARALASTDLFLNPSITESFGNVTLEAMACGLPVIAASASGATNLVRHKQTGMLVTPQDTESFVEAIAAYRDPALRAKHGRAGLAFAKTMDWDEINAAVLRVYTRVIARRRPRP
ncbi:glycosyltransferase family 1 protein [Sphingomonas sp. LY160]|uniref:glycosyltransferase family 4 protein n=1 Tax=Sphingomonas sp. LY160 TaxID=3095342 RepID=UPI002ADECE29|nr:glycosyltransferase family 1 protein [Sphingomonas sp. LY160]MEA1072938.1 glycosyltransferase family 1 protein [Sphingomonas sp. LY160]